MGNVAPATVSMMYRPAAVLGQTLARIMPRSVCVPPLVTRLVTPGGVECSYAITAAQAVGNPAILIHAPGMVVGDLFEYMGMALVHVVAGIAKVGHVDIDTDL